MAGTGQAAQRPSEQVFFSFLFLYSAGVLGVLSFSITPLSAFLR